MNIASILIGLFLLFVCILPIIWFHVSRNKKQKKFLKEYLALGNANGLKISVYDNWNYNYIIGIDLDSNSIFYLKKKSGSNETLLINLNEIRKCRKIENTKSLATKSGKVNIITKLQLELKHLNPDIPDIGIEFYDADVAISMSDEPVLTEKWNRLINLQLSANKVVKRTKSIA